MSYNPEEGFLRILERLHMPHADRAMALVEYASMLNDKGVSDEQFTADIQDFCDAIWPTPITPKPVEIEEDEQPIFDGSGYVYLIGLEGQPEMVKIGVARDVKQRLAQLATGSPYKPYVIRTFHADYPYALERALHAEFAGKRTHGEWFRLSDVDVINALDTAAELLAAAPASQVTP